MPTTPPSDDDDDRLDRLGFKPALALVLAAAAALALGYRYLPLLDWPQHVSMASVTEHFGDPKWGFSRYYRMPGWFLPYQSFRLIQATLGRLLGDSIGFRAALLPYLVGLPLCALALARRFGRDRWVALAAGGVVVEANLLWGFAPFVTGTLFLFAGVVVAIDTLKAGGARRFSLLCAIGVLIFFTHPQTSGLFCAAAGLIALFAWILRRVPFARAAGVALALAPSFAMLAYFFWHAGWADGSVLRKLEFPVPDMTHWLSPKQTILALPSNSLALTGNAPAYAYAFALAAIATAAIAQSISRRRRNASADARSTLDSRLSTSADPRWAFAGPVLLGLFTLLLFTLPAWGRGEPIAVRIPSLALLILPLTLPLRPPNSRREFWFVGAARVAVLGAALFSLGWAHHRFRQYEQAVKPLDRVIAQIPPDARVATLIYETVPAGLVALPTYVHLGGYLHAARGGYQSFNFNVIPYANYDAKHHSLVPWVWAPSGRAFQLAPGYAEFYDYVFLRKGPHYPGVPFAGPDGAALAEKIFDEGGFELWRTRRGAGSGG